jgi:gp16 family phage-associated protein
MLQLSERLASQVYVLFFRHARIFSSGAHFCWAAFERRGLNCFTEGQLRWMFKRNFSRQDGVATRLRIREQQGQQGQPVVMLAARLHGFYRSMVCRVVNGELLCRFGVSHKIAVLLELKEV